MSFKGIVFILFLNLIFSSSTQAGGPLSCAVFLNGVTTSDRSTAKRLDKLDQVTMNSYQFLFPTDAEGEAVRDFSKIFDLPPLPIYTEGAKGSGVHFQKITPAEPLKVHVVSTSWSNVNIHQGRLDFIQLYEYFQPHKGALVRKVGIKQLGITTSTGKSKVLVADAISNTQIVDVRIAPKKVWTRQNSLEQFNRKFRSLKKLEEDSPKFRWVASDRGDSFELPELLNRKVAILFRPRSKDGKGLEFLNQPVHVEGTLVRLKRRSSFANGSLPNPPLPFYGFSIQIGDQIKHFGFLDSEQDPFQLIDILEIRFE